MDNKLMPEEEEHERLLEEKREKRRQARARRQAYLDSKLSPEELAAKDERRQAWRENVERKLEADRKAAEEKAVQEAAREAARVRVAEAAKVAEDSTPPQVGSFVRQARAQPRHWGLLLAFLLIAVLPSAVTFWYLQTRAADQYASTLAFTVRSDETMSATDLLGGLGQTLGGGSTARDTDILYEFILSQEIVRSIDEVLDLEAIFSARTDQDPILGYKPGGAIEDLTAYWKRMVRVSYDNSSGLMELRILAFTPEEATRIAEEIYDESTQMINQLSQSAREDATRYAEEDLEAAIERLKNARDALTTFRLKNQMVDPNADIQMQMGLITTLQTQLADALIEYDLISTSANANDPRVEQASRRIAVIEARIDEERDKFGAGGGTEGGIEFASTISEFERLTVDREFAEAAYAAALRALDGARADASRKSRYLAAYVRPTVAEKSQFPKRGLIFWVVTAFAFLIWAILCLVYYALRDRS